MPANPALVDLQARVAALAAGSQPSTPPNDPVVLTSVLNAAVSNAVANKALIGRKSLSDANYTITQTDAYVALSSLTASRTFTLPAASSYPPGQPLYVADESGSCSPSLPVIVAAAGSDKIGDPTGLVAFVSLGFPFQKLTFHSNGTNLWTYA